MKSNYNRIGDYIRFVDERNSDLNVTTLLGLTISKKFIPSVANTVGTDMSRYKIIRKNQFACSLMQVRRDKKIPVALQRNYDEAIISQAYPVFEIIDKDVLLPEYLMMWMCRSEFDREACFYAVGGVRGSLEWEDFCNMKLPVPSIEKQKAIVEEYNIIVNRIKLNEKLNQKLEETAQAIYKHWFVDFEFPDENGKSYKSSGGEMVYCEVLDKDVPKGWNVKSISKIIPVKDGTHDSPKPTNLGLPLVTSKHLNSYDVLLNETYNISLEDFEQINKRSKVDKYDILYSMIGTVGNICFVLHENIDFAIKNVGLFKASEKQYLAEYILFYLKSDFTKQYIESCILGSTQNYVTLTELRDITILLPSSNIIENFRNSVKTIINSANYNVKEKTLNNSLREFILEKLTQE